MFWFWIALVGLVVGLAFVLLLLFNVEEPAKTTDVGIDSKRDGVPTFVVDYLAGNGVELPPMAIYGALACAVAASLLGFALFPMQIALLIFVSTIAVLFLAIKVLGNKRRAKMLEQLPSFINQVTRRLSAGISVENAFADSVETLERPLGTVMRRVVRRVHMGYELHQAFEREAQNTKLHEFNVLATAIRINEQYGGSIRTILDDIVGILRLEESGKRELSAMTGETRFTAVVLAVLPILIGGYMFYTNPEMMLDVWEQSSGRKMLYFAGFMELTGIFVLWRMINSIDS